MRKSYNSLLRIISNASKLLSSAAFQQIIIFDKNNEEKKKYERGRHEAERGQYEVEQKKTASRCMRLAVGPNSVSLGGG
ncbi:hypothetical protein T09_5636 [Trichinella sp. T9]|nr:hypothetical protein T09_5636 [Trichinella sp. T9]